MKNFNFKWLLLSIILSIASINAANATTYHLRYKKGMQSSDKDGNTSQQLTQFGSSNRYYCELSLDASSSYGFFIRVDNSNNNCWKANATASTNQEIQLYSYGGQHGNSTHRVTYTTGSAGTYIFTYDINNHKISVSPKSSQTVKVAWSIASGHDGDYNLGTYTTLSQEGSSSLYSADVDLTAVKHYMFVQTDNNRYWKNTATMSAGTYAYVYDYGTNNYGDSGNKNNFTPSAAGKYRFTWDHDAKMVKYERLYALTYNGNGSSSGSVPAEAYYLSGTNVTVAGNTGGLVKTGYTFVGWNTASNGSGKFYPKGSKITTTGSNTTLYAMWLQAHSPAGIGNTYYGESLTQVSTDYYEVYRTKVSSSTVYVNAGTSSAPETSGTRVLMSFSCGSSTQDSTYTWSTWMAHTPTYGNGSVSSSSSGEFPGSHSVGYPIYRQGQGFILVVTGYDQFSLYGKDADTNNDKQYHVYINDVEASPASGTSPSTTLGIRRYTLTPGIVSVIRVVAHSNTNGMQEQGFSLRLPAGECSATAPGALSKGTLSGCSRTITASGSPETNNTWYWQSSSTGTDKSDAYSLGKAITAAGTYYLRSYCSTGSGCWSDAVSVEITAADMTPSAPTALTKSSITAKGVTLTVEDAANTNDYEFYVSTSSPAPGGSTPATHSSNTKSLTITNLYAGTTFYAWARAKCGSNKSAWTALTGSTFTTSTVSVTHTLTNVTKTSGATTAGGSDYTAEFAAVSGYSMPNPTVTIGGNAATSGTHYTWSVDGSVGTITIPANKINGNIVITLNSVPSAPSSAVISGTYHYFPGDNISLTCTPSGNNGPTTYQWYKGGTADGNRIAGATSATYTKNSCTFDDAGSYYCQVTCNATSIWAVTNSHENYDVKILRLYVNGSKGGEHVGYVDFVKENATTATASISLGSNWTYGFNIADGCGHYYGNYGTMQENNCTNWTTNVSGTDCGLTTTNAATYIFTINYSNLSMITTSVTFPVANQAAGKVIYFDNNVLKWTGSSIYYRIGHSSHSQADQLSLVPGTANLYKMTTREYNGFFAWQIGNAAGGNGSGKSIYNTKNTPAITASIAYEGGAVTAAVTVTPGEDHSTGGDAQNNNNCEFYSKTITSGMKTDRVTITEPSNGTITVNYTNTSNVASSFTSGYADLAHTCIITPTATASTGYKLSGLTVNGSAHTSGSTYTVTAATTVAATFAAKQSAITFDKNGGTGGATGTTGTYGSTMTTVTIPTRLGYTFDGYWDAETDNDGSGTKYYNADGTSARTWDKNTESATTLYAKWVAVECPAAGSGETVFKFVPVTSSSDNVASSSGAELTTSDYLSDLVNGHVYAYGSSASNVTMTSSGVKVASSTGYLKLDFDCALIAGDQIKWKSDQNSINLCNTTSYNSSNDLTLAKSNSSYSTVDITSAMVGKQTLYLVYNTGVATMMYFEIIRPAGYSVTYKANGGTGSDVVRIHATAASLATVGFTRAGYDFTGWKTGASSGTDYAVGDEITEEVTLYAQWTCVTPTFGTNLSTSQVDYEQGASASALTVAATANGTGGNGTVSYQWYSNTTNSTAGATPLTGQTSTSYTPSTASLGTMYYYCVATNSSSGCSTTATSNIAKIVVSEAPCFKFVAGTTKAGSGWDVANNGSITTSLWSAGDPVLTGGTMTNTSGSTISAKNKSSDTHYGLVYAANGDKQVTVTLSGSHVLAEDAVITINGFSNNSTTACGFKISGNDMSPATYTPGSAAYTAFTQTYTVTAGSALEGASSFTVDPATSVRVYLKSISVTGCEECTPITPTLTAGTTTLYTYPTATSTTLTLDKDGSTGDVTWTSSDASIASVSGDGTSATVTAVGTGSATITASIATDGTHCAKSVSKTFTVTGGCGYNVIASAVLTSKTAATTSGCTLLASNMSNSSAPYKLDKTLPSYFGLQLSSGSFQVGDSIIFKVKIGDMDINDGTTYPVAVFASTSTDYKEDAIYISGSNTKGTDNVYIRFAVTSSMLTALNTNKQVLILRNTNIKQNHSMYSVQVKRHLCPEGVYEFTDATGDGKWSTAGNWVDDEGVAESLPTISDRVIISKPVTVDDDDAVASEVILDQKSPNTGKLTIDAGNALIIAGTLKKTTTGTSVVATAPADVIINSTRAVGTGALVMGSHDGTNAATVNFETKVKYDNGYVNQYLGSPFSDETPYVDYEIQLYKFVPQGNGSHGWWNKLSYGDEMVPFMGYNQLSNNTSGNYLNLNGRTGHLNASSNVEFTIANGKMYYNSSWPENMFANSWTAPIHIDQFEDGDFTNVKKVIYIFNAGTPAQYNEAYGGENSLGNDSGDENNEAAGTYTVIPVKSAAELSALGAITTVIPAMQAFSVMATSSSPSLTLNFNRLVYTPATTDLKIEPTRAPKRNEERPDAMRLRVRGENGWTTNAYILGREDFTNGYDDGWDGEYMEGDGSAPQLYSATEEGYFVVNCVPEIEGTLMAFHPGRADNTYTLSFVYNGSETWYLNDVKEQKSTLISNETTYLFVSNAGDNAARFVISKIPYTTTEIATGVTNLDDETLDVQKVIYNDKVYIIRNGRIYGVDGHLVK